MYKMLAAVFVVIFTFSTTTASIVSTQFHSQDGHGGYSYGHSGGPSSKTEHGTAGGVVSGSFSYVDGHGIVQTATYTADPHSGFKIHASNLPVAPAPVHAPVPVAVPAPSYYSVPVHRPLGVPVVDTPEVAAAKVAHLAAVEHQKLIVASHPYRRRRDIHYSAHPTYGFNYHSSTVHAPGPVYHHAHAYPLASHEIGVPVTDTPEVSAAKSAHLAAVAHAKATIPVHAPAPAYYHPHAYPLASHELGVPVTDTPEVSAAKSAHLAAVAHAKATIPVHAPAPAYYHPHAYPLASHEIGVPVTDTPEVIAAKSAHLSAVAHAKSALGVY